MEPTKDGDVAPGTELTIEPLFIELRTLAIRGRHMKPGLLRQFVAEDLIDAEGPTLRGRPKAWHLFHEKSCVSLPPHIHVLWQKGTAYRVAQVLWDKEQDERYNARLTVIEQRCFDLCDLLALILAQDHRFDPGPIESDRERHQRHELPIGVYTLSLSPNTCFYLRRLEEARRQRDLDALAIASVASDEMIRQAHLLLSHLYDQGIVLGHPTLDSDFRDERIFPIPLGSYGVDEKDEDEGTARSGETMGAEKPALRLRWRWRYNYREGNTATISDLLLQVRAHEPALLAAVSDLIVQQCLRKVQEAAQSLINDLGVVLEAPKLPQKVLEGGITLLPLEDTRVWELYEDEDRRLEGYSQAWEQLCAQLFTLDQIFIDV